MRWLRAAAPSRADGVLTEREKQDIFRLCPPDGKVHHVAAGYGDLVVAWVLGWATVDGCSVKRQPWWWNFGGRLGLRGMMVTWTVRREPGLAPPTAITDFKGEWRGY